MKIMKKVIQLTKLNIAKNSLSKIFYLENKNITITIKESAKYDIETSSAMVWAIS